MDAVRLVEIIELKWLLAGQGIHVHVERLQNDSAYARETLERAAESPSAALRETATRLRLRLGLG
jgi:predicted metal-dependent phosphoesterase TrpH